MAAPIRAGSGTRLKILEAFAAGIPVVSTTIGAEGIAYERDRHLVVADSAAELADALVRVLEDDQLASSLSSSGLELARERYDWGRVADTLVRCYDELLQDLHPLRRQAPVGILEDLAPKNGSPPSSPDVSILIPTLNGGEVLERCLDAIAAQESERSWELICIDSGSRVDDVEAMRRLGARVLRIDKADFNHGLTRDLAAAHASGRVLVFLNQDAVPADELWLERLVAPLEDGADGIAAVQGAIRELPDEERRFFWDSCGERFYFTSESVRWLGRHAGIGFSTVNCAIRRSVWRRHPFGWAPIMEDKKWQGEVSDLGLEIVEAPEAVVLHTHDYDLRGLLRRCRSEGYGWRTLGERYTFGRALRDMLRPSVYRTLAGGILRGRVRSSAELLFPWARPLAVWYGNRIARDVAL
jgi:rhamnosyltransferase